MVKLSKLQNKSKDYKELYVKYIALKIAQIHVAFKSKSNTPTFYPFASNIQGDDLWVRAPLIGGDHVTNPGFGTPYIRHTLVPSVVNKIFFRYRQNIFC